MNLADAKYFDACIWTSNAGREQLRVASLIVARAILGYSSDLVHRRDALLFQQELEKYPGALDLCIVVRKVWQLGALVRAAGVDGVAAPMAQLEAVAKNIYSGPEAPFPWGATLIVGALAAGGGYLYWRSRQKRLPARAA